MTRYIFSNGQVTVEDGVPEPVRDRDRRHLRGVLILVRECARKAEPERTRVIQKQESDHVKQEE